jgi:transposase
MVNFMRHKGKIIQKRRQYSIEFKQELVRLFDMGKFSVSQLDRLYGVRGRLIYRWIYQHSRFNEKGCRIVEMKQSSSNKLKELEARIKQLEQMVGQKQIKIEFLEKMIDIAEKDLKISIKKKPSTPQSTGSTNTAKD